MVRNINSIIIVLLLIPSIASGAVGRTDTDGSNRIDIDKIDTIWTGTTWGWVGTSLCEEGSDTSNSYPELVASIVGATVDNGCIDNSTLIRRSTTDQTCANFRLTTGLTSTREELQLLMDSASNGSAYCATSGGGYTGSCTSACNGLSETDILNYSFEAKLLGQSHNLIAIDHGTNDTAKVTTDADTGTLYETWLTISAISNANPAVITTTSAHGLSTGDAISLKILDDEGDDLVKPLVDSDGNGIVEMNSWTAPILASCSGVTYPCATATGSTITTNLDSTAFGTFDADDTNAYTVYDRSLYYEAANFLLRSIQYDNPLATLLIVSEPNTYIRESYTNNLSRTIMRGLNMNISEKWASPLLDMSRMFSFTDSNTADWYTTDRLHPTELTHRQHIADRIAQWMANAMMGSNSPKAPVFYDYVNGYIGIGTTKPDNSIHVVGADNPGSVVKVINTAESSSGTSPIFVTYQDDEAALELGDRLFNWVIGGSTGDGDGLDELENSASIRAYTTEDWVSGAAYGTEFILSTVETGTAATYERLTISDDVTVDNSNLLVTSGNYLGIGDAAPDKAFKILGTDNPSSSLVITNTAVSSSSISPSLVTYQDDETALGSGHRLFNWVFGGSTGSGSDLDELENSVFIQAFTTEQWVSGTPGPAEIGSSVIFKTTDINAAVATTKLTIDDDVTVNAGDLVVSSGALTVTTGSATISNGDLTVSTGDIVASTGDIVASSGDIVTADGSYLGVGKATPVKALDIVGSDNSGSTIWIENESASGSTGGSFLSLYHDDGAALASGDRMSLLVFGGSSSASALRNGAMIKVTASENWVDSSAYGTQFEFQTVSTGATSVTSKLTVNDGLEMPHLASSVTGANDYLCITSGGVVYVNDTGC